MSSLHVPDVALDLLRCGGMSVGDDTQRSLGLPFVPAFMSQARAVALFNAAMTGFFQAAASGHTFTDPDRITQQFGRTLEQNYPEAGAAFLKFARTYWTLRLLLDHAPVNSRSTLGHQLLAKIEETVAGLFFPTPGPVRIDPDQREAAQRDTLRQSGASIDIEDFIAHNPILIRDRAPSKTGCAAAALATVVSIGSLVTLLFRA